MVIGTPLGGRWFLQRHQNGLEFLLGIGRRTRRGKYQCSPYSPHVAIIQYTNAKVVHSKRPSPLCRSYVLFPTTHQSLLIGTATTTKGFARTTLALVKVFTLTPLLGHVTGVRAITLSFNDDLAATISKGTCKIWNVAHRICLHSATLEPMMDPRKPQQSFMASFQGCAIFCQAMHMSTS
jgi:hypothetical protein